MVCVIVRTSTLVLSDLSGAACLAAPQDDSVSVAIAIASMLRRVLMMTVTAV